MPTETDEDRPGGVPSATHAGAPGATAARAGKAPGVQSGAGVLTGTLERARAGRLARFPRATIVARARRSLTCPMTSKPATSLLLPATS